MSVSVNALRCFLFLAFASMMTVPALAQKDHVKTPDDVDTSPALEAETSKDVQSLENSEGKPTDSPTLTIGSVAPEIDIEHWIGGTKNGLEPVTKFEEGKVYLIEFWATGCAPCIQMMPHLADLQEKYKDRGVQIISVSNEDLETVQQFLKRDYKARTENAEETGETTHSKSYLELTSMYSLTTDPDGSTHQDYCDAAGIQGIPVAFLVGKSGLVEWIGNPGVVKEPLDRVVNDSWDRIKFVKILAESKEIQKRMDAFGEEVRAKSFATAAEARAFFETKRKLFAEDEHLLAAVDFHEPYVEYDLLWSKERPLTERLANVEYYLENASDEKERFHFLKVMMAVQLYGSAYDQCAATLQKLSESSAMSPVLAYEFWFDYKEKFSDPEVPSEVKLAAASMIEDQIEPGQHRPVLLFCNRALAASRG